QEIEPTVSFPLVMLIKVHWLLASDLLAELDLYPGQELLLMAVAREEGIAQGDLGDYLNVEPPTVARSLQRLERAGLVERRLNPHDGRVLRVYLTAESRALRGKIAAIWQELNNRMLKGVSGVEQAFLRRLLVQLRDNISQGS
ncbi:MAG: MarR family winged helix-turn-helix transcriptional regulator, partial [Actinomycetota bacterium]|nr:MarR family winged helix-turn-helix transcriptional regulator [Actinomycetota bacterium]